MIQLDITLPIKSVKYYLLTSDYPLEPIILNLPTGTSLVIA